MLIKLFGGRLQIGKDINPYTGHNDLPFGFLGQRFGTDYRTQNKLKAYKNVVYGCTSLIGEALGDYTPFVEQKKGDTWERIDHEFINLLRQPAGIPQPGEVKDTGFSSFDLWEATGIFQVLQGDAFWYIARGKTTGRPREIVLLRADKVGTDIDKDTGKVSGYFIRQAFGDPIPLALEDVIRFKLFNPENPYRGKSVVEAGADYIETDEGTAAYTKNFFKNGAGLSGVLNVKGEVTKNAYRKFVRAWREKYEGVGNAGKIAVLRNSDASFQKVGLGLDELDMNNLRKMSLADVCMMFKVPAELLGKITEGSGLGRGNVETLEYIFTKWNIDKKMKRFDRVIEFALQRYYDLSPDQYRVSHENIIPEDKEFALAERDKAIHRWLTPNEIRAKEEGIEDIEGGDQLFVGVQQIPLNEAAGFREPVAEEASASIKVKLIRSGTAKKKVRDVRRVSAAAAERFRLSLMRNQLRYERQFRKKLKPVFRDQRAEVLFNLEAHASSLTRDAGLKLFDDAKSDAAMLEVLTPTMTDLAQTQGALALVFAGDEENEFYLTTNVLNKVTASTSKMAGNFNDETLARLNKTLAEGIQAGEGIGALKARVTDVYDDVEGYRAARIARTETLKATNDATVAAYKQTGYIKSKVWVVNPGACPECAEFEGKSVPLDDAFLGLGESYTTTDDEGNETVHVNDYDTVEQPPLHPNCRCTVIPSTE